ncbi:MAG: hypothetical protein ACYDIA_22085 [Candidatus Humimicrobiaceae bacterium]
MIVAVGNEPISPLITLLPVLVIPEPAKTAKEAVVPRSTVVGPAISVAGNIIITTSRGTNSNGK